MLKNEMATAGNPLEATEAWFAAFNAALQNADGDALAGLFVADGHWRDVLALTWHLGTVSGAAEVGGALARAAQSARPEGFRVDPRRTPPRHVTRAGTACVEVLFAFDTTAGPGSGVLRLIPDPDQGGKMRGWTMSTTLDELRGHEERIGARRPKGPSDLRDFGGDNWLDLRRKARAYEDHDPAVLVVGGGQAGLAIAARLGVLGVDTLIVDRHERVGDNWRKRYHSLTLHNEVFVNHMPYMPFPPSWPVYIPKDMLANWFESYVEAMEINFWTSTEFVGASYDDAAERWTVTLKRTDGAERVLHPRHLVFATGVSSIPHVPELPGLSSFRGTVVHSSHFADGTAWKGKKALVLGTGTSGHDVAQDLYANGADVSLIQRSMTYVVSLTEAQKVYAIYGEGIPFEDCDLLATSVPYPVLLRTYQLSTVEMRRNDQELLDKLAERGFRLHYGEDESGFQMMYLRRGGGYYFNVGCSNLIVDGKVGLLHYHDLDRFTPEGARMKDGSTVAADLLVLATGYKSQQDVVRRLLGDTVADRIGPVWGFDDGGELRNMWKRTAQKGLWFTAGSLAQCRIYSRFLAMQVKACEEGLLPLALPAGGTAAERGRAVATAA
jgi:cation diffusion facilitator CzcD-associated flavoprotein CzcO